MKISRAGSVFLFVAIAAHPVTAQIGVEKGVARHLQDGAEFDVPLTALLQHGEDLFRAVWTVQDGGGRPLNKGTGAGLSDSSSRLVFPRNFNRISAPDANSCFGCHAQPRLGGGGDIVTNVFVLGQRFDFVTFDPADTIATRGSRDELGRAVTQQSIANERATIGLFGSGFIEMLARQMSAELQAIRDSTPPGGSKLLITKGVSFGILSRLPDGRWDVSKVEGLPATSLVPPSSTVAPNLLIRPFHQAGRVVSIREFTNNAYNHHHGMQSTERFGMGADPDGDGVVNELTRADITAASVFQATLPVPGRVIPRDRDVEAAIRLGETRFSSIGCAHCHVPALPITDRGWVYAEPNPFNPPGNLRAGEAPPIAVDLTSDKLPPPRLSPDKDGVVYVPAYTDLKLHDICSGPEDPNSEVLDMQQLAGSAEFFGGNRKFLTRKLWGAANEPPYFHHGRFTTLREAVLAHSGEALKSRMSFGALPPHEQDAVIEFLKSLQVLRPGTRSLIVDENGNPRADFR